MWTLQHFWLLLIPCFALRAERNEIQEWTNSSVGGDSCKTKLEKEYCCSNHRSGSCKDGKRRMCDEEAGMQCSLTFRGYLCRCQSDRCYNSDTKQCMKKEDADVLTKAKGRPLQMRVEDALQTLFGYMSSGVGTALGTVFSPFQTMAKHGAMSFAGRFARHTLNKDIEKVENWLHYVMASFVLDHDEAPKKYCNKEHLMAMKSLLMLCQFGWVAALSPGDCAFVGIYGDQDDFALVLMEDAEGEQLSLTEEYPTNDHFKVSKSVVAKKHVSDAKRGSVLKKADFEADSASFVAPTALTVFTGSQEAATPLCSINLEAKQGSVTRKLSEEVSVVMLGLTDTAQYAGSTSGSKEELLEDISNPSNWHRDASRKLSGFSIASGNMTETESTSMMLNATVTVSTTATTVVTMTDTATETTVVTVTATETEFDDDEGHPDGDAACHSSLAFGLLFALLGRAFA